MSTKAGGGHFLGYAWVTSSERQGQVTHGVPPLVVYVLKVVSINHHQHQAMPILLATGDLLVELVDELPAVGDFRQGINRSTDAQFLFQMLAFGNIGEGSHATALGCGLWKS